MKPLSAGSEIDAWCTRCRLDLGHRIVAMVQGRPKRVICQTCGSQHNFRPPRVEPRLSVVRRTTGEPSKPRQSAPSQRARAEAERRQQWEAKILGQSATAFIRYSIDRSFQVGELIMHRKFGEGYVSEVLEDSKINVMFRDGPRTLAHGHG